MTPEVDDSPSNCKKSQSRSHSGRKIDHTLNQVWKGGQLWLESLDDHERTRALVDWRGERDLKAEGRMLAFMRSQPLR